MHKYKCIFIHIPKNAGTSILKLLGDKGGRKHAKWYDFYESNDYFYKKYSKIAVVRNPYTRLYSAYLYCLRGGNQSSDDIRFQEEIIDKCNNFEDFVINVLDHHFIALNILFTPQYLFTHDRHLNCQVDLLLKFENLDKDWQKVALKINCANKIPKLNQSKVENTELLRLSSIAHSKIRALYQFDFLLFGYEECYEKS